MREEKDGRRREQEDTLTNSNSKRQSNSLDGTGWKKKKGEGGEMWGGNGDGETEQGRIEFKDSAKRWDA